MTQAEKSHEQILAEELEEHYREFPDHRPSCCRELDKIMAKYIVARKKYLRAVAPTASGQAQVMFINTVGMAKINSLPAVREGER